MEPTEAMPEANTEASPSALRENESTEAMPEANTEASPSALRENIDRKGKNRCVNEFFLSAFHCSNADFIYFPSPFVLVLKAIITLMERPQMALHGMERKRLVCWPSLR